MTALATVTREAVPVAALPRIRDKVAQAGRKCARWDLPQPALSTSEPRRIKDPYWDPGIYGRSEDAPLIEVVDISITAPERIGIPGWALLARIDALPDGGHLIIRSPEAPGVDLPEVEDPQACDHCHSRRHRKDTFLVLEEASGRILQVGRDCLKDHLGYDPERLLLWSRLIRDVEDIGREPVNPEERLWQTSWVLLTAARVVSVKGYMSARKAEEYGRGQQRIPLTTRERVEHYGWDLAKASKDRDAASRVAEFDKTFPDDEAARRVLAATVEGINEADRSNEWQANIATIVGQQAVRPRHLGIAVSAVLLGLQRIERPAKEVVTSEPLGSIGDRLDLKGRVTHVRLMERSGWGYGDTETTTLIKFRVGGSDVIHWAGKRVDVEEGDLISMRATVSKHEVDRFSKRMATTVKRPHGLTVTKEPRCTLQEV